MLHIITVITEICHCPNPDGIYLAVFFFSLAMVIGFLQ